MTTRTRKTEKLYRKTKKAAAPTKGCTFCQIKPGHEEFVEEGKFFMIIKNRFNYSYWDEQDVEHQVMLVPKMHTKSIRKLPIAAASEFLDYIGKYEDLGYNVYARSPDSTTKTVPHQHTHLIKTNGVRKKLIFYTRKPFMLFTR